MTTAHRPTFDPARGKEALRGPAYHQRLQPAHTQLKFRQAGQGGDADDEPSRDLAAELLAAEAAHFSKKKGAPVPGDEDDDQENDAERAKEEEETRERNIALGNPLLNKQDYTMKRRWDDDVVFRNQARGTEDRNKKKEFVNDMLRSDFHRRFMSKYVR
ncbi:Pre-mRNA-splicing factor cwc15 [Metarhizium anisopliae]|nr:Pre-mRNA-splicing factor cwc15 [Metarhizium anisopliae]